LFHGNGLRPPNYTYSDYVSEFNIYVKAMESLGVGKNIQGATFCSSWSADLVAYTSMFKSILRTVSYHIYPTSHCNNNIVTIANLLNNTATEGVANRIKQIVAGVEGNGVPYVLGETNSASCGGMSGVSDVFASTLWAVDYMFSVASVNVAGVNFHGGSQGAYTPIAYNSFSSNVPDVRPLYYALYLFSEVTKNYAKILKTDITSDNAAIRVWVVQNFANTYTAVIINKDLQNSAHVTLTPPTRFSSANLGTLTCAGGISGKNEIFYAGITFDGSSDGLPVGQRKLQTLTPTSSGNFVFDVAAASIAVVFF